MAWAISLGYGLLFAIKEEPIKPPLVSASLRDPLDASCRLLPTSLKLLS
jgi:hypothetical protein